MRHGFRIAALTLVSALIAGCGETPQNKAARGTYLVVSVIQDTERNLAELIALRRRQGWEVVVRQMNQPAPDDVKAAIAAEKSAHAALSHVLLVGSDALLPMVRMPNYKTQRYEKDLPILTDDAYGMPDDAGVPRLAVGRFPTDDGERLRRLAGKVVRYETELDSLSPHLFLLVGRQPADEQLAFGGFSAQRVVDNVSAAFIDGIRGVLEPNLKLRVRTAFPGNDHYPFEESAEVLREALARRPAMSGYAGHANRRALSTMHRADQVEGITRYDIEHFSIDAVSGPFVTGGCSVLDPEGGGCSIGETILFLSGGPAAVAGYTRTNDDFFVMQFFETLASELRMPEERTLGELILAIKRRMSAEPQSARSRTVQFGALANQSRLDLDYEKVVRKNNALLTIYGDPAMTLALPRIAAKPAADREEQ